MGRRCSLWIFGVALWASWAAAQAQARDDDQPVTVPDLGPTAELPAPPSGPLPIPKEFPGVPPEVPEPADPGPRPAPEDTSPLPAPGETGPLPAPADPAPGPKKPAIDGPARKKGKPGPSAETASGPAPGLDVESGPASPSADPPGSKSMKKAPPDPTIEEGPPSTASPLRDPSVFRSNGAAPPGAPTGSSTGAGPRTNAPPNAMADGLDGDRILMEQAPLGKQSVAVTVDVQSPAALNMNQPALVRLIVRNTGSSDALNVIVHDTLPEGLTYVSSEPEALVAQESLLSWTIPALPAGSERTIALKVKPVKTGPLDHAATARFQVASKARCRVYRPMLKVDQVASTGSVLKGRNASFRIAVTNIGDGPARNVAIRARLSPGLRHGPTGKTEEQLLELTLPTLAPNQREELDPLEVHAVQGGNQSCEVTATSPDVIGDGPDALASSKSVKSVMVVEPKLAIELKAPEKRYTETVAPYEITLTNGGTAPARRVRLVATLPVSGRLVRPVPAGATYDDEGRRLVWNFDQIEPGAPRTLSFAVRLGGIGLYEVLAEARGDGDLRAVGRKSTEVDGLPDVDLVVSERLRVIDVGGKTVFQIRLRNYGTKEARNLAVRATLSKNLRATAGTELPDGLHCDFNAEGNEVVFTNSDGATISVLGPRKEIVMGLEVEATGPDPQIATCRVKVTHDDLSAPFDDMAHVKILAPRSGAATGR